MFEENGRYVEAAEIWRMLGRANDEARFRRKSGAQAKPPVSAQGGLFEGELF